MAQSPSSPPAYTEAMSSAGSSSGYSHTSSAGAGSHFSPTAPAGASVAWGPSSMTQFSHMQQSPQHAVPTHGSAPPMGAVGSRMGSQASIVSQMPTSVVELSISARNLRDMDVFSKSDPMCVIFLRPFGSKAWAEAARTEAIQNTLNPDFTRKVKLNYLFEEQQHVKIEVYDVDSKSGNLAEHDFIGSCTTTLGQIVSSGTFTAELRGEGNRQTGNGSILITSEESSTCKDDIALQFLGKKLDRKDFFGSSDPFLQFSRSNESGRFTVVHRTEHLNNNTNPTWKPFTVPVRTLCNGDLDRSLRVECFDHNRNGSHSLIGEFFVTVRQLQLGPSEQNIFKLINPKKKHKKNYKHSGLIHLIHCETIHGFSFLDHIRGGTELACTISIDFTASNGSPHDPASLHYTGGYHPNQYETAIKAVGDIVQDYDSDKLFPVLGFGAKMRDGRVSHCFYVNGHDSNPYCNGMEGVIDAYKGCLRSGIHLYGPTNFAPTINHVASIARRFKDGSQYFILLIITDGIITDMHQTKSAIVEASTLPLSIIIVGVGTNSDFEAMEELDGDSVRLTTDSGKAAARDIVQFVPFQNFLDKGLDSQMARLRLAREVLAEVPEQFVSYMKANRIRPKQRSNGGNGDRELPPDPEGITGGLM